MYENGFKKASRWQSVVLIESYIKQENHVFISVVLINDDERRTNLSFEGKITRGSNR